LILAISFSRRCQVYELPKGQLEARSSSRSS